MMTPRVPIAAGNRRLTWKVFGVLMAGALVGTCAVLPHQLALVELPSPLPAPLWLLLAIGTLQNMLLFGAAAGLGLWLGEKVGLGARPLRLTFAVVSGARYRLSTSRQAMVGLMQSALPVGRSMVLALSRG